MSNTPSAALSYPVHALIENRWSPRAFDSRAIESEKICSLLEAARWAPSCFNEQPWRFVVGDRERSAEALVKLQSTLMDGNAWAKNAPVLILSVVKTTFTYNNAPNRFAAHDVGLAVGNLILQAEALGLITHQMGGFDADKARDLFEIPLDYAPMALIAIGYMGDIQQLPADLQARETAPRERHALQTLVHGNTWGQSFPICFT